VRCVGVPVTLSVVGGSSSTSPVLVGAQQNFSQEPKQQVHESQRAIKLVVAALGVLAPGHARRIG
jgi:hypothetical protein